MSLFQQLQSRYSEEGPERVGFIKGQEIVEVYNISSDPSNTFIILGEDIINHALDPETKASWHTHPGRSPNLSVTDYESFLNFPDLLHCIVGKDEIRVYRVEDGAVIEQEADSFTWLFEEIP